MEDIKTIFKWLDRNKSLMNPYQARFIDGLKKYFSRNKNLTEKQLFVLYEIRNNLEAGLPQ